MANSTPRWKTRIIAPSELTDASHLVYQQRIADIPPTAVLVFHGIGEEVRYETLSRAASLILQEAQDRNATDFDVVIRSVPTDRGAETLVVRAELNWTEVEGYRRQVHAYEVYWAPLTVGKITYWETIKFLLSAGKNGLRGALFSGKPLQFNRWLFGEFRLFPVKLSTIPLLVILIGLIGFVIAIIAMAVTALADAAKQVASGLDHFPTLISFIYHQISIPINYLFGFVGISLRFAKDPTWQTWLQVTWALLIWVGLIAFAYWLRGILTQYAGSLVAYLSPFKDSKFEELRSQIQAVGFEAASTILNGHQASAWIPKYERIVYVAHSLGTVLAYDTLNALINTEGAKLPADVPNPAVLRTRAFITLGCPLDKTAFLFRVQLKVGDNPFDEQGELRETMVGAVQPLIADHSNRWLPDRSPRGPLWINLWSPQDIISGSLAYYDDPAAVAKDASAAKLNPNSPRDLSLVQNIRDKGAWIPIAAHNQYWKTPLMRKTVYDQLFK